MTFKNWCLHVCWKGLSIYTRNPGSQKGILIIGFRLSAHCTWMRNVSRIFIVFPLLLLYFHSYDDIDVMICIMRGMYVNVKKWLCVCVVCTICERKSFCSRALFSHILQFMAGCWRKTFCSFSFWEKNGNKSVLAEKGLLNITELSTPFCVNVASQSYYYHTNTLYFELLLFQFYPSFLIREFFPLERGTLQGIMVGTDFSHKKTNVGRHLLWHLC